MGNSRSASILDKNSDFFPCCLPFAVNPHSHTVHDCVLLIDLLVFKIKTFPSAQSGILNLSDYQLTEAECEVLEKGLNFNIVPHNRESILVSLT